MVNFSVALSLVSPRTFTRMMANDWPALIVSVPDWWMKSALGLEERVGVLTEPLGHAPVASPSTVV